MNWIESIPTKEMVAWRRWFHQHPELSFEEQETSNFIFDKLQSFGVYDLERPTPTSVVATLHGGGGDGPAIALRADIDALPVQEETGLPFASEHDGVMHACGHDAHAAMLLATAAILARQKDSLAGTVKLIFQHAEELAPGGAQQLVEAGVMEGVDEVYGMHVIPNLPSGSLGVIKSDYATTAADGFFLTIHGKGGHASSPHLAIDPIVIASELVLALQTAVSRSIAPDDYAVLTIGAFNAGMAPNIIADTASLAASIRTTRSDTRVLVERRVREIVEGVVTSGGATYELDYVHSYGALANTPALADEVKRSAQKVLGESLVYDSPMLAASEDFSAYTKVVPGTYLILGVGMAEDGFGAPNHNPQFKIDEAALENGVKVEVQIVLDRLSAEMAVAKAGGFVPVEAGEAA